MKRNITIIFIVVLIGSVSIAVVRLGLRSRAQGPGPPYVPLDNRLQWYAQQAKATAKDEIEIPSPNVDYGGSSPTTTLDSALSAYTVVLAEPIQEITIAAGNEIVTWYRFKTLEILISHESPACPGCYPVTPPRELHLQAADEFAAAKIGGVVAIDGVKVSMINRNFPQLKLGSTYLLFISRYSTGGAEIGAGPNGVFTIDVNGKISPLSRSQHPIQRDIETKLDNSLDGLRRYVQKRHGL